MKQYKYKIIEPDGVVKLGAVLANNKEHAQERLTQDPKTIIIYLKQNHFYFSYADSFTGAKVEKEDVIGFTRQLQMLVIAGISLLESLVIMQSLNKRKGFSDILKNIIKSVKTGDLFSQSLVPHQKLFGTAYIALIKAGETAGALDSILLDLYHLMNWEKNLIKKVKSALRYPIIVISVSLLAMVGMFKFVVPKFTRVFMRTKSELPLPTKIILKLNSFFASYGLIFFVLMTVAILFTIYSYRKKENFQYQFDKVILKIPFFGGLLRRYLVARFCRVFSVLYRSGVKVINALSISKKISNNAVYQRDVEILLHSMERGVSIGESSKQTILFSGVVGQMAAIGERSSSLDTMLEKMGELYNDDINYMLDNIFAYIEPAFIIIMGFMILGFAFGILLPMWRMMGALMGGG
jgi:type II secretory pathway component PulF